MTDKKDDIAKEKPSQNLTEQESQDYLNGKMALPDEALDIVSGGGEGKGACPMCGESNLCYNVNFNRVYCGNCAYTFTNDAVPNTLRSNKCPKCHQNNLSYSFKDGRIICGTCNYSNTQEFHEMFYC